MKLLPLLCLCLLTLSGSTFAEDVVVVNEGDDAILPCSLSTKQNIVQKLFDWKKDDQEVFLYDAGLHYNSGREGQDERFKGRVFHFPEHLKFGNASIVIKNTKVTDSGNYTCDFPHLEPRQIFHIKLVVGCIFKDRSEEILVAAPEPYTRILSATENGVRLQCEVRGAYPKPKVEWQDSDGKVLSAEDPQVSERGGSYNIIVQTTVTKTANNSFFCEVKQEDISHIVKATIIVPEIVSGQLLPSSPCMDRWMVSRSAVCCCSCSCGSVCRQKVLQNSLEGRFCHKGLSSLQLPATRQSYATLRSFLMTLP